MSLEQFPCTPLPARESRDRDREPNEHVIGAVDEFLMVCGGIVIAQSQRRREEVLTMTEQGRFSRLQSAT